MCRTLRSLSTSLRPRRTLREAGPGSTPTWAPTTNKFVCEDCGSLDFQSDEFDRVRLPDVVRSSGARRRPLEIRWHVHPLRRKDNFKTQPLPEGGQMEKKKADEQRGSPRSRQPEHDDAGPRGPCSSEVCTSRNAHFDREVIPTPHARQGLPGPSAPSPSPMKSRIHPGEDLPRWGKRPRLRALLHGGRERGVGRRPSANPGFALKFYTRRGTGPGGQQHPRLFIRTPRSSPTRTTSSRGPPHHLRSAKNNWELVTLLSGGLHQSPSS